MSSVTSLMLDTCIWLDAFNGSRPGNKDAVALLDGAIARNTSLFYAVSSLKDVFYLIGMTLKKKEYAESGAVSKRAVAAAKEMAWACVKNMMDNATPIAVDYSDIWLAMKLKVLHDDLEDNLVIAALRRANTAYVVTTDQQLIKHFPQEAIGPEKALELLEQDTDD